MSSLYDDDILLWSEQQAAAIRRLGRNARELPNELDIENVAEEIEGVGRSELAAVESYLELIFVHLIRLVVEPDSTSVRHWRGEIAAFHANARRRYSPSMRQRIDVNALWRSARATARGISPHFPGANAMTLRRRTFLRLAAGAAALPTVTHVAQAQTFPSKPVTLIVPWPPGGTTDVALRALATATERHLGRSIVSENKAGAGGTLGPAQMAALAKPDGYTVSQLPITVFRLPFISRTSFDPTKDFTYIIGLSGYTFGVVVRSDAPWKTFHELLAAAKANPGTMTYGTPGAGTSLHITMEQIARHQGIKLIHVPFKGNAEATTAVLGGHIHALADATGWAPQVNEGKLRLLVSWGASRTKNWPTVPTLIQ